MVASDIFITLYIQLIFVSVAFWESYVEGFDAWAAGKQGWKIRIGFLKKEPVTAYHLFLYLITIPAFLLLPLVISGFSKHLFLLLMANYFLGLVVEDFMWFVVNPVWGGLAKFNSRHVYWHRFLKIGNFEVPDFYLIYILLAVGLFLIVGLRI